MAVDDEPDVLTVLEEEIKEACPYCTFDKSGSYKEASERLASWTYDLVIVDIMGVRGFDLLKNVVFRQIPGRDAYSPCPEPRNLEAIHRIGSPGLSPKRENRGDRPFSGRRAEI